MEVLNNREIAITLWLLVILVAIVRYSKTKQLIDIAKLLRSPLILIPVAAMIIYVSISVYLLSVFDLWSISQLKTTVLWTFTCGLPVFFKIEKISEDVKGHFKSTVRDILKLTIFLEFLISFYVFPLVVELVFVPSLFLLGATTAYADRDEKYATVKKVMEYITAIIVLWLIYYGIYSIFSDPNSFVKIDTLREFTCVPLLSILYLPFIGGMAVYCSYENVFKRLRIAINDPSLISYAKRMALMKFHLRISLLDRWYKDLLRVAPKNECDIKHSISEAINYWHRERNPPLVKFSNGWCPFLTMQYLKDKGLTLSEYCKIYDETWVTSGILKLTPQYSLNTIGYFLEGDELVVQRLLLKLSIFSLEDYEVNKQKYVEISNLLFEKALNSKMPEDLTLAINEERDVELYMTDKGVIFTKECWKNGANSGHFLKLSLQNSSFSEN